MRKELTPSFLAARGWPAPVRASSVTLMKIRDSLHSSLSFTRLQPLNSKGSYPKETAGLLHL